MSTEWRTADDLRDGLVKAVSAETSRFGENANLGSVQKRARSYSRRLVVKIVLVPLVLAAALVSFSAVLDSDSNVVPDVPDRELANGDKIVGVAGTQTDTAAAFAVRAVAGAGLLDPSGYFLDYQGIEKRSGEWTATFDRYECSDGLGQSCDRLQTGFQMTVAEENGTFTVSEHDSPFDYTGPDSLAGYTEETGSEPSRLTYPTVRTEPVPSGSDLEASEGAGTQVVGVKLWEGPLPAPGVIAECTMSALNDEGDEVFSEQLSDLEAPGSEAGRSGGMLLKVIPVESDAVSEVAIECESAAVSDQPRWIPTGEPHLEVQESVVEDKLILIVTSELVWAAEERPSRWDSCSAVLYDDQGKVLGHGSGSARASKADPKERPLAGGFGTVVQVDERPDSVEVKC